MSVTIWLSQSEVKQRLAECNDLEDEFSMEISINDIDHDDLENEDWYEDRFGDHLDDDDLNNAREEGYDDGYEAAKEENTNETMDKFLMLRDMIAVGSSDKNIVEKLKEILRDEGVL